MTDSKDCYCERRGHQDPICAALGHCARDDEDDMTDTQGSETPQSCTATEWRDRIFIVGIKLETVMAIIDDLERAERELEALRADAERWQEVLQHIEHGRMKERGDQEFLLLFSRPQAHLIGLTSDVLTRCVDEAIAARKQPEEKS